MISAANWSEVWQKALDHELPIAALEALAQLIDIVDVNRSHAERAASLWQHDQSLSLADRLCLALASERDEAAMTADRAWATTTAATITLIR